MNKFPNIVIKQLEREQLRFTTAGDWMMHEDGSFEIHLLKMDDWRYSAIVLIHELTEIFICWRLGITAQEADDFDRVWEDELKKGIQNLEKEAGFDKRCPYRKGHVWGARMERLFCFILGVNWNKYCNDWDNYFKKP